MIQIDKKLSIDKIEALYILLEENSEKYIDVLLPLNIESTDFAIVPSLVQFVSTWLRRKNAGKLLLDVSNSEIEIEGFMQQDYAFPIIIMSWKNGIYGLKNGIDLKKGLRPYTIQIQHDMRALNNIRGNKLMLTCFDHLADQNGLLDCFYSNDKFIASEDVLHFTFLPSLTSVISFNRQAAKKQLSPIMDDLLAIIYELMKNTDDWARKDEFNKPLNPNVRGLFIKFIRRKKQTSIENFKGHIGFKNYFDNIETNSIEEQYFVELSVFDSGAGFVNRFLGPHDVIGNDEKLTVVKKCLIKNNTSASGLSKHGKGLGLDRILKILDGKGLLWIRTDSLSVYRNMKKDIYKSFSSENEVDLYDWNNHTVKDISEMKNASGTVLSIIYPISDTI